MDSDTGYEETKNPGVDAVQTRGDKPFQNPLISREDIHRSRTRLLDNTIPTYSRIEDDGEEETRVYQSDAPSDGGVRVRDGSGRVRFVSGADRRSSANQQTNARGRSKTRKKYRFLKRSGVAAAILASLYLFAVYSNVPIIKELRELYINTAMSTMTHQWLATAFIPRGVIEQVRASEYFLDQDQRDMVADADLVRPKDSSAIGILRPSTPTGVATTQTRPTEASGAASGQTDPTETTVRYISEWLDPNHPLYAAFPEIDSATFNLSLIMHSDDIYDEDGYLFIDEADRDGDGTTIKTIHGDTVLAVDTRNGILLVQVTGKVLTGTFNGVLAIVRDPAQVGVAVSNKLGSVGERVPSMCERNNAILGINANGFDDNQGAKAGTGNGGRPYGYIVFDGKVYSKSEYGDYKVAGFDENNVLFVGAYKNIDRPLRDAAEFKPILINNGKNVVANVASGEHPRTAIGQKATGEVLMLVVNGRDKNGSWGCKWSNLADIMERYGAVQATNMDGGSSSVMFYNGRVITFPSGSNTTEGRQLPNAFVVYKNDQ